MSIAKFLARVGLYPLLMGGSVIAVLILMDSLEPLWAMNIVNVTVAAVLIASEWALPYRPGWAQPRGDTATDLAYVGLSLIGLAIAAPIMTAFTAASLWLAATLDVGLWPHHWNLASQVALALVIYELGSYSFHWLCHRTWLWRIHSVHHSVERLYWLNSMRSHPIDYVAAVATTSGPLLLLGIAEQAFAVVTVIGVANMMIQHTNADMRTGFLDWLLVTPAMHRWHHSPLASEQQRNLGAILLIWDLIFRSRLAPADREPPEDVGPGTPGPYPPGFLAQLVAPVAPTVWTPEQPSGNRSGSQLS
jgi:sterol desaturase/sphingolipid hydroxylase (fatty acid hydroxylase superfamily)